MGKNALIISTAETFSVRGIEMKMKGIGADVIYSSPKLNDMLGKLPDKNMVILFMDEDLAGNNEALVFLKDHCLQADLHLIVIGSRLEVDRVKKTIPNDYIVNIFDRPLDMEKFLDAAEQMFLLESQAARRKSILIVDDDVTYMTMISDWLKDSYRISMVNSGVNAITWLATNHADLLLLDYEMPVTSGPQVLEMIRSQPNIASTPVIFLTGKGDRESIMKVLAFKPSDYLLKTIDRKGLHDKIDTFFIKQAASKTL